MDQIWKEPTDNIYDQTKQGTPIKNNISDMKKQNDEDIYIYIYIYAYILQTNIDTYIFFKH